MNNHNTTYRGFMISTIWDGKVLKLNVFQMKDGNQLYKDAEGFTSVQNAVEVAKAGIDRVLSRAQENENRINNY